MSRYRAEEFILLFVMFLKLNRVLYSEKWA